MSVASDDIRPLTFTFEDDGLLPNNSLPRVVYTLISAKPFRKPLRDSRGR
ncbi:MAG: hypothetical protein ABIO35_03985 [Nitrobacter sp.]